MLKRLAIAAAVLAAPAAFAQSNGSFADVLTTSGNLKSNTNGQGIVVNGYANASAGVAVAVDNQNAQTSGKILSGRTNAVEKFYFDSSGNLVGPSLTSTNATLSAAPASAGSMFALGAQTFTDNATAGSGTATIWNLGSLAQPTLAATNSSVVTTNANTLYVGGAPIKGSNDTATTAAALFVDSSASCGAQTACTALALVAPSGATTNNLLTTSGNGQIALASGTGATTISATTATARAGVRIAASRIITASKGTAPPDCAGGTLNLTVAQFLEAGIFTCGTAQTVNLPTWQGASGIVQALPGTPAVGDIVQVIGVATAGSAITMGFGTGGSNGNAGHTTVPANSTQTFNCRITAVTANSETATCY